MAAPRPRHGHGPLPTGQYRGGRSLPGPRRGGPPTPWPDLWTRRRPGECAAPHPSRYIHPVPSPRVGRCPAVDGGEGAYICREDAVPPPAAGPRATPLGVPLPHRGAPFGGDSGPQGPLPEYAPGRAYWSTANWPTPRLPPCLGLLPPR